MQNKIIKIIVIFIEIMLILQKPININNKYIKNDRIKIKQEKVIIEPRVIKDKEHSKETKKSKIKRLKKEMNKKIKKINVIQDKEKWFIEYKKIIEQYSSDIKLPESIYDYFSSLELDLLFRVVQAEIGDEYSFEQKINVVNVIFNRKNHKEFPNNLMNILTADQFSTISNNSYKNVSVSEKTILACEYAFIFGDTTNGCLFFDSNHALKYYFVFNDGAHNFYKLEGEW